MFSKPLKSYENFQARCVYFVQQPWKFVQLLLNVFLMFSKCATAFENISCFWKNVRLLLKDIKQNGRLLLKRKICAAVFRQMCGCSWKYFMFFKEHAAASEKLLKKMCGCFWRKMCSYFLVLCPLKKYFEVKQKVQGLQAFAFLS